MLEDFAIRPHAGQRLDTHELLVAVSQHPCVVRLPARLHAVRSHASQPEEVFVVCGTKEQRDRVKAWADSGNTLDKYIGSIAILEITPLYIAVYQPAPVEVLEHVAKLLLPVLKTQKWRVFSEMGDETDLFKWQPENLFK